MAYTTEERNKFFQGTPNAVESAQAGLGSPEESSGTIVGNIFEGVGFGAIEAVRNFTNLLPGVDWENPIDTPDTWYGGLIGGFTQFALPYGALTKLSSLGALGLARYARTDTGAAVKTLNFLGSGAGRTAGSLKSVQAAQQGNAAKAFGWMLAEGTARGTVKGMVVDAFAFNGTDPNLSSWIQSNPDLANPITQALATDDSDPEWVNRFKNVIEGIGMGAAFDSILVSVKATKAYRGALSKGAAPEEAAEVAVKAASDTEDGIWAARQQEADIDFEANLKDQEFTLDSTEALGTPETIEAPTVEAPGEARSITGDEVVKELEFQQYLTELTQFNDITDGEGIRDYLGRLEATADGTAKEFFRSLAGEYDEVLAGGNPRKMTAKELIQAGLDAQMTNLAPVIAQKDGHKLIVRALERYEKAAAPPRQSNEDAIAKALQVASGIQGTERAVLSLAKEGLKDSEEVAGIAHRVLVRNALSHRLSKTVFPHLERLALQSEQPTASQMLALGNMLNAHKQVRASVVSVRSELGRALQQQSLGFKDTQLDRLKQEFTFTPLDELMAVSEDTFDAAKAQKVLQQVATVIRDSSDPSGAVEAAAEFMSKSWASRTFAVVQEFHINSLLSGVSTQAVNVLGGLSMTFWRPMERIAGAGFEMALSGGNPEAMSRAVAQVTTEIDTVRNLLTDFWDSYRAVRRSSGDTGFSSGTKREGAQFSPSKVAAANSKHRGLFEPLADLITLPSQSLEWTDKFIKTWNGRARYRALVSQNMKAAGLDPLQIPSRSQDMTDTVMKHRGEFRTRAQTVLSARETQFPTVADEGRMVSEFPAEVQPRLTDFSGFDDTEIQGMLDAHEASVNEGLDVTFQTPVTPDNGADKLALLAQSAASSVPAIRFFAPFIRTPYNIARFGWDRSVGAAIGMASEGTFRMAETFGVEIHETTRNFTKLNKMLNSPDPALRAQAKTNMSYAIGIAGYLYANVGQNQSISETHELPTFTGSGPSNPDALRSLKEAGWQPFSVRVGDNYVSYSRFDPFATLLGIAADAAEYANEAVDSEADSVFQAVSLGIVASMANNLTSKTYMQGFANLMDLANDPDTNAERVLGATAGSFVPTFVAHTNKIIDPELREIRTWLDRVRSRVPGLSKSLPVRRDLLGEPLSHEAPMKEFFMPLRITAVRDGVVREEIAKFAYGFSQPSATRAGVDLMDPELGRNGQLAYDRFLELTGATRIRGMDLRQALRKEIKSESYRRLDPGLSLDGDKSPRIDRLNSIIRKYRQQAWEDLQEERPDVRREYERRRKERADRRRGLLTL